MQQAALLRLGVASLKICHNLFYNLYSFYRRMFLFAVAATSCGRGWGSLRSKSVKNLFYNLSSFYRRMFLLAVAAGFAAAEEGGVASLKIWQKSFLKSFFFLSAYVSFCGCSRLRCCGWGVATLKIWQNLFYNLLLFSFFGRYTFLGRCAQNLAKSTLKSFSHISRTFSISPLSYRSYHSENKPSGPKLISMPYG